MLAAFRRLYRRRGTTAGGTLASYTENQVQVRMMLQQQSASSDEECLPFGGKTQQVARENNTSKLPRVILNTSADVSLLISRALLLESVGFVVRACSPERALARLRQGDIRFDAALLCHSIDVEERVALAERMRASVPNLAIILMHLPGDTFDASVCDAVVMAQAGPEKLLRAIERALRRRSRA